MTGIDSSLHHCATIASSKQPLWPTRKLLPMRHRHTGGAGVSDGDRHWLVPERMDELSKRRPGRLHD